MKNNFKIYNFQFGTIKNQSEEIKIEMDSSQFDITSIDEIKHLYQFERPEILPLKDIKESETSITLIFDKTGGLKNLREIKHEEYPVKVAIVQRILEQDVLHQYEDDLYISLNPSTIYYYPMQTVSYTYLANGTMPKGTNTKLERYRACVVSVLSGIGYEKCLNSPEDVKKQGNELIQEIYNQNSRAELLAFIRQSNNFMTYDYISKRQNERKKTRNKYFAIIGGVFVLSLASTGVLLSQLNQQENQIIQAYEAELDSRDTLIEANEAFYAEEYEQSIELYLSANYDTELLASRLIEQEQYQLAFNVNQMSLEDIIQAMYEREHEERLLDLEIAEDTEPEQERKLTNEQTIIDGDSSERVNVLNFLNDENTAERLGLVYVEENDLASANQILEEYPDSQRLQEAIEQAEVVQQRSEIEESIATLESELEELSNADEDEEDIQEQTEELQNTINELRSDLEELGDSEEYTEESSD